MYTKEISKYNALKKEIEKILRLCDKYDEDNDGEYSFFDEPVKEEDMLQWERENGTQIPESYKEWLRFTSQCRIAQNTATFWGPEKFNSEFVPDDLVVIGELIGDGERVCFSKNNGMFVDMFENKCKKQNEFSEIIKEVIDTLDNKPFLSHREAEELRKRIRERKAMREKGLI